MSTLNALIIGRFNIPHTGHLDLVRQALLETNGTVFIAIIGNGAISAEERGHHFLHLGLSQGVHMNRTRFIYADNAYDAIEYCIHLEQNLGESFNLYCGEDRYYSYVGILSRFPMSDAQVFVTERPEGSVSSTYCRTASYSDLMHIFHDDFYCRSVMGLVARGA